MKGTIRGTTGKLTAIALAVILIVSDSIPYAFSVKADDGLSNTESGVVSGESGKVEDVEENVLRVDYSMEYDSLEAAATAAMSNENKSPEDYEGIVIVGENELAEQDFKYINTVFRHVRIINMAESHVKDDTMGMQYGDEDGDGYGQYIGEYEYGEEVQAEEIVLPETISKLDLGSLYGIPNLKELVIPDSVTVIEASAFYQLLSLERVSYHGLKLTSVNGNMFGSYGRVKCAKYLDFSGASNLESIEMIYDWGSSPYIGGFDFTGCTSLKSVKLSKQLIDFSCGDEKEWIDSFKANGGTADISGQTPMLTFYADAPEPIEINGEFAGAPVLQGKLKDGTDILADGAVLPDWLDSTYKSKFCGDSSKVEIIYINSSGEEGNELDSSVGGRHIIRYEAGYMGNPILNNTVLLEVPVEVLIPEEQKRDTVYIGSGVTGASDNRGTEGNPCKSISEAFGYMKENTESVKLCIMEDVTLPAGIRLPSKLTIEGETKDGAGLPTLTLSDDILLDSDLTLDSLKLDAIDELSIYANGNTLTIGDAVSDETPQKPIDIYGGGKDAMDGDTHINISGGNFNNVFGGTYIGGGRYDEVSEDGSIDGNTYIKIGGTAVIENVYGGGNLAGAPLLDKASADVNDTYIEMYGGKVTNLYGGGRNERAEGSANASDAHISIYAGNVETLYGGGYANSVNVACVSNIGNVELMIGGAPSAYTLSDSESGMFRAGDSEKAYVETVYGGGYAYHATYFTDSEDFKGNADADVKGNVTLTIEKNAVIGRVYGGGYAGNSEDASARVDGDVNIYYRDGEAECIYGAGEYSKHGYSEPNKKVGVAGGTAIYVEGGKLDDVDRLCADGEHGGIVGGEAIISISGYGSERVAQKMPSIYHFDKLVLDNSHIEFPAGTTPNISCGENDDSDIEMKNNSSMIFGHSVTDTFAVNNLTTDGTGARITLNMAEIDSAVPLTINGIITTEEDSPIELLVAEGTRRKPQAGDAILVTGNEEGNYSLVSKNFELLPPVSGSFKLIKKSGALILTSLADPEKGEQDKPRLLEGIAPSGYGEEDGRIENIDVGMEYALMPDGPFTAYKDGMLFEAGTYYVRFQEDTEAGLLASDAVQVIVPAGKHSVTYSAENGRLFGEGSDMEALQSVEHSASFSFSFKADAGYMLDLEECSITGGGFSVTEKEHTITGEVTEAEFTVNNVEDDVVVYLAVKEIPGMVKISGQPHDVTVRAGNQAVFEIAAEGTPEITYQWQKYEAGRAFGTGFVDIAGETNPTYVIPVADEAADGTKYRCIVKNPYSGEEGVASEAAVLHVIEAGDVIVAAEEDNAIIGITAQTKVTVGDPLTFTAYGAGTDNDRPAQGDTRFVPSGWTAGSKSGSWTDKPYSAVIDTSAFTVGKNTLSVIFIHQRYNGEEWENTDSPAAEKSVVFELKEEEETSGEKPSEDNTGEEKPSEDDTGGEKPSEDGTGGEKPSEDDTSGEKPSEDDTTTGNSQNDTSADNGSEKDTSQETSNQNHSGGGQSDHENNGGGKPSRPGTGDSSHVKIYATLAMISGFVLLYIDNDRKGMSESRKRELVRALIEWGRRGRLLRKAAAAAAIFVFLLYYHSVGKQGASQFSELYGE